MMIPLAFALAVGGFALAEWLQVGVFWVVVLTSLGWLAPWVVGYLNDPSAPL